MYRQNSLKKEKKKDYTKEEKLSSENATEFFLEYGSLNKESIIEIETGFGKIRIRLFENTPLHRANFLYLINNKYFNTTFFHRVSKNHVIQAALIQSLLHTPNVNLIDGQGIQSLETMPDQVKVTLNNGEQLAF